MTSTTTTRPQQQQHQNDQLWKRSEEICRELNIPLSVKQAKMCFETLAMQSVNCKSNEFTPAATLIAKPVGKSRFNVVSTRYPMIAQTTTTTTATAAAVTKMSGPRQATSQLMTAVHSNIVNNDGTTTAMTTEQVNLLLSSSSSSTSSSSSSSSSSAPHNNNIILGTHFLRVIIMILCSIEFISKNRSIKKY